MNHTQLERQKNTTNSRSRHILTSCAGNSTLIAGIFLLIGLLFFFMLLFQKQQLHLVTGDVSKDITAALTGAAGGHLYDSYAPLRDSTSGAFVYNGRSFREIQDAGKFRELFAGLYHDVELRGDKLVKLQDGREVFTISDLKLFVSNASGSNIRSYYRAEYTLIIPNGLLWVGTSITLPNQEQTIEYMNRFG